MTTQGDPQFVPVQQPGAALDYYNPTPTPAGFSGVWREGNAVVIARGAQMPFRCIKCNGNADGARFNKTLVWMNPLWGLLALGAMIVLLIVYFIVRKTFTFECSLCHRHRKAHRTKLLTLWLLALAGVGMIVFGFGQQIFPIGIAGVILFFVTLILGAVAGPLVKPKKIDGNYAWVLGAGREFLLTLPDVNTPFQQTV